MKRESDRQAHRHGRLGRQHRQGDDQAQRERGHGERGRDRIGKPGRRYRSGWALKACRAGRPNHGLTLQLLLLRASESMGNHDSNVVGAGRVG
jgi:hypothetical protein